MQKARVKWRSETRGQSTRENSGVQKIRGGACAPPRVRTCCVAVKRYCCWSISTLSPTWTSSSANTTIPVAVRSPYLDIDLVDFVRRIPSAYKFRRGQTKYLLKKSLEPVLPRDILHRPKKGFGVPIGPWIRNGYLGFDEFSANGILNPQFISQRLTQHRQGISDQRAFLWNAWLLSAWSGKARL